MSYSAIVPSYEAVAEEYYDPQRHPTCHNFGELSKQFLYPRIQKLAIETQRALELGAGKSIAAAVFEEMSLPLSCLTIFDQSESMLRYSQKWISAGAIPRIGDAKDTRLQQGYFDLIVSSLGDPYDCDAFWREMRRIIVKQGLFLFTTPSFEWSSKFRSSSNPDRADFLLRDGRTISVPSFTRPLPAQRAMIEKFGFVIIEECRPRISDISGKVSPKLNVLDDYEPVLYCFTLKAIS